MRAVLAVGLHSPASLAAHPSLIHQFEPLPGPSSVCTKCRGIDEVQQATRRSVANIQLFVVADNYLIVAESWLSLADLGTD